MDSNIWVIFPSCVSSVFHISVIMNTVMHVCVRDWHHTHILTHAPKPSECRRTRERDKG